MVIPTNMPHCLWLWLWHMAIPEDMPHYSENVCVLVVLDLKEVGLRDRINTTSRIHV